MIDRTLHEHTAGAAAGLPEPYPSLHIAAVEDHALFILRARQSVFGAIAGALASDAVIPMNRAAHCALGVALHLGPDEWWFCASRGRADEFVSVVRAVTAGLACALIDISHRTPILEVSGPGAIDALATGCPQALDPKAFPIGKCTRTLFEKAPVMLWRTGSDAFRLTSERSYLPYIVELLGQEAASQVSAKVAWEPPRESRRTDRAT